MKTGKSKKKWMIGGCILLAAAAAGFAAFSMQSVAVEAGFAEKGEVVKLVKESATVEAETSVIVSAKNAGEVETLLVEEGDTVKAGDLLMESDLTSAELDIRSLEAELSGLRVQYAQAKSTADKNKSLYEQGAVSKDVYDASKTAAKQLAAQISSLSYTIEGSKEASGVSGVTAPIDGTITAVYAEAGETVAAGASLFEISDLSSVYIKADLIAEDADLVEKGDSARVYNDDAGFSDDACTVRKVFVKAQEELSELGINQRRVAVEIALGAAAGLRLGSDMDVEIVVDRKETVLRVSEEALFEKEGNDCVYVIENGKAALRVVETGLEGEDYIEIRSGLKEGESVILSPNDEVVEGVKVKAE